MDMGEAEAFKNMEILVGEMLESMQFSKDDGYVDSSEMDYLDKSLKKIEQQKQFEQQVQQVQQEKSYDFFEKRKGGNTVKNIDYAKLVKFYTSKRANMTANGVENFNRKEFTIWKTEKIDPPNMENSINQMNIIQPSWENSLGDYPNYDNLNNINDNDNDFADTNNGYDSDDFNDIYGDNYYGNGGDDGGDGRDRDNDDNDGNDDNGNDNGDGNDDDEDEDENEEDEDEDEDSDANDYSKETDENENGEDEEKVAKDDDQGATGVLCDKHLPTSSGTCVTHVSNMNQNGGDGPSSTKFASNNSNAGKYSIFNNIHANNIYVREVHKAFFTNSSDFPETGSKEYYEAVQNYALYGKDFLDFPENWQDVLPRNYKTTTTTSTASASAGAQAMTTDNHLNATPDWNNMGQNPAEFLANCQVNKTFYSPIRTPVNNNIPEQSTAAGNFNPGLYGNNSMNSPPDVRQRQENVTSPSIPKFPITLPPVGLYPMNSDFRGLLGPMAANIGAAIPATLTIPSPTRASASPTPQAPPSPPSPPSPQRVPPPPQVPISPLSPRAQVPFSYNVLINNKLTYITATANLPVPSVCAPPNQRQPNIIPQGVPNLPFTTTPTILTQQYLNAVGAAAPTGPFTMANGPTATTTSPVAARGPPPGVTVNNLGNTMRTTTGPPLNALNGVHLFNGNVTTITRNNNIQQVFQSQMLQRQMYQQTQQRAAAAAATVVMQQQAQRAAAVATYATNRLAQTNIRTSNYHTLNISNFKLVSATINLNNSRSNANNSNSSDDSTDSSQLP